MEIVLDDFPTPHYEVIYLVKRKKANMVVAKNQTTGYIKIYVKIIFLWTNMVFFEALQCYQIYHNCNCEGQVLNAHNWRKGLVIYNLLY